MTEAARSRVYVAAIVLLLLVIAAMAWKFIVAGSTRQATDGRVKVVLDPGEREFVLHEMRGFVSGLQRVTDALSRDDMRGVARASREMGAGKAHDAPVALLGKLPLQFKTLAFGTHRQFDEIAAAAEAADATPKRTLAQLAAVMQQCVACHEAYQFGVATGR